MRRKVPGQPTLDPRLLEKSGVFVTLLKGSGKRELRGCIGAPYPNGSLLTQLSHVAVEAATEDLRFTPVSLSELKDANHHRGDRADTPGGCEGEQAS